MHCRYLRFRLRAVAVVAGRVPAFSLRDVWTPISMSWSLGALTSFLWCSNLNLQLMYLCFITSFLPSLPAVLDCFLLNGKYRIRP